MRGSKTSLAIRGSRDELGRLRPRGARGRAAYSRPTEIKLTYRDGGGSFHADWPLGRIDDAIADKTGLIWVDILGPDEHETPELRDWLCHHFQFHHLAVEDALAESHIAKVDDWGEYLYIVFHVAGFESGSDKLDLHELDVFLGPNYLITYHTAPLSILDQDRVSIERDPRDRLRNGADHLLYRFLELAIDQSLLAIEHLDDKVDQVQNAVIENASPQVASGDLPAQAGRPDAAQNAFSPARGARRGWPVILFARYKRSIASIFATCTTTWCGSTISPKASAT